MVSIHGTDSSLLLARSRGELIRGIYPSSKPVLLIEKMKLFELRADFGQCCSFLFRDGEDIHMWDAPLFDGTPRNGQYPIPKGCRDDELKDGPLPDFTQFALRSFPTLSERAVKALDRLLEGCGEYAEIELDEPLRYFAFNATTLVDVLDEERSQIRRFRDGRVMAIEKHVLSENVDRLPSIFKIPQTRIGCTYVNEEFVSFVRRSNLIGFRFDLLYEK